MRGVGRGDGVSLPDIHLAAASAAVTGTRVGSRGGPAGDVGLRSKEVKKRDKEKPEDEPGH